MMFLRYNVRYQPLDQINLIFQGLDDLQQLLNAVLVTLDGGGWKQGMQEHEYLLQHDDTLRYETEWRTHGSLLRRFHVRFWYGDGEILGSAHRERVKLWPPSHEVRSFDEGKRRVEDIFRNVGWQVNPDGFDLRQWAAPIADPPANGRASVITYP